jgi:Protein of unknown function (DUF2934)
MKQRRSTKGKPSSGPEVPEANPSQASADSSQTAGMPDTEKVNRPSSAGSVPKTLERAPRHDGPSPPSRGENQKDQNEKSQSPTRSTVNAPTRRQASIGGEEAATVPAGLARNAERSGRTRERIAQRAYELYQAGGYEQGRALEHWLEAEREVIGEDNDSDH